MLGQGEVYSDETVEHPARRRRRGDHRLGRALPGPAARRRHGERPARDHDPRHGARPRRVHAPRADGPRGRLPGRRGALEAGPAPVHRGRPAAPRHLRVVRRPGDGQRRRDRAPPPAVGRARAPASRAARAPVHDRVDPDHARPAGGPRADHGPPGIAHPVRQHRDRGRRAADGPARPADRAWRPRRRVPRAVGARRDRHRDVGRRAQRAGPHRGRVDRRPRQPLPRDRDARGQPDRRAAHRAARGGRRPDPGAARTGAAVRRGGVRAREAVRRAGVDRAAERRELSRRRGPGTHGRPHRAAQPRDVQGLARAERHCARAVRPGDDRPRRVQAASTTRRATRQATACCARSPGRS